MSDSEKRKQSCAAADRLAIQNLSDQEHTCLLELWAHKGSLLVSNRYQARRFQTVPCNHERGENFADSLLAEFTEKGESLWTGPDRSGHSWSDFESPTFQRLITDKQVYWLAQDVKGGGYGFAKYMSHVKEEKIGIITLWTDETLHEDMPVPSSVIKLQFMNPNNFDATASEGVDPYLQFGSEALTADYYAQLSRLAVFYAAMPTPSKQWYFSNLCLERVHPDAWYYSGNKCLDFHLTMQNCHYTSSEGASVAPIGLPTGRSTLWSGFTQIDLDYMAPCPVAQHAIKMMCVMRPKLMIAGHTAHEIIVLWQVSEELNEQATANYSEEGYGEFSWLVESYRRRLGIFASASKTLMELPPGNHKTGVLQTIALRESTQSSPKMYCVFGILNADIGIPVHKKSMITKEPYPFRSGNTATGMVIDIARRCGHSRLAHPLIIAGTHLSVPTSTQPYERSCRSIELCFAKYLTAEVVQQAFSEQPCVIHYNKVHLPSSVDNTQMSAAIGQAVTTAL